MEEVYFRFLSHIPFVTLKSVCIFGLIFPDKTCSQDGQESRGNQQHLRDVLITWFSNSLQTEFG